MTPNLQIKVQSNSSPSNRQIHAKRKRKKMPKGASFQMVKKLRPRSRQGLGKGRTAGGLPRARRSRPRGGNSSLAPLSVPRAILLKRKNIYTPEYFSTQASLPPLPLFPALNWPPWFSYSQFAHQTLLDSLNGSFWCRCAQPPISQSCVLWSF